MMKITRRSQITGIVRTMDLAITEAQICSYEMGNLLQNAFPNLSPSEREFFKSGITDEEWQAVFGQDSEED